MGNGIATNQLMKMVAGAINPGKPVANLYVCTNFFHYKLLPTNRHSFVASFRCGVTTLLTRLSGWQEI